MTQSKRMLLVDSTAAVKYLTCVTLKEDHIDCLVDEVSGANEAIQLITNGGLYPDIILLNSDSQHGYAEQFLQEYKQLGLSKRSTKLYIILKQPDGELERELMPASLVSGYFPKPFRREYIKRMELDIS